MGTQSTGAERAQVARVHRGRGGLPVGQPQEPHGGALVVVGVTLAKDGAMAARVGRPALTGGPPRVGRGRGWPHPRGGSRPRGRLLRLRLDPGLEARSPHAHAHGCPSPLPRPRAHGRHGSPHPRPEPVDGPLHAAKGPPGAVSLQVQVGVEPGVVGGDPHPGGLLGVGVDGRGRADQTSGGGAAAGGGLGGQRPRSRHRHRRRRLLLLLLLVVHAAPRHARALRQLGELLLQHVHLLVRSFSKKGEGKLLVSERSGAAGWRCACAVVAKLTWLGVFLSLSPIGSEPPKACPWSCIPTPLGSPHAARLFWVFARVAFPLTPFLAVPGEPAGPPHDALRAAPALPPLLSRLGCFFILGSRRPPPPPPSPRDRFRARPGARRTAPSLFALSLAREDRVVDAAEVLVVGVVVVVHVAHLGIVLLPPPKSHPHQHR